MKRRTCLALIAIAHLLSGCTTGGGNLVSQPGPMMDFAPRITADVAAGSQPIALQAAGDKREDMMDPIVLKDALTNIDALEKTFSWKPFRPGVEIARIYNTPDGGPSAAFLRYEPGASVPLHMHGGYEHIFILKGSQLDRSGEHGAGTVIINPPGSTHLVASPKGCIVLIIWDKPVVILEK